MKDLELIPTETSDRIRLNGMAYLSLRTDGGSYVSKRAAAMLSLTTGDLVRFYRTKDDPRQWYIGSDPGQGATVYRNGKMFKFSDTRGVRDMFAALGIDGTKADFRLAAEPQVFGHITAVFIIPEPINLIK